MRRLLSTLVLSMSPWVVFAAEHEVHSDGIPKDMLYALVNFGILVTLLTLVLRVPVKDFFKGRALSINDSVDKANLQKQQADQRYQEYEAKLKTADQELRKLIDEITEEGQLEKKKILADAQVQVERIAAENQKMIEQEVRKAKEALKAQTIQLSIELAGNLIKKNLGEEDQKKIVGGFINQVETLS